MDNSFSEKDFTWEIVPNDKMYKAQKDELIYAKDGILDQIKLTHPLGARATVFMPYEVGEYSMYIHENLSDIYKVGIITDDGRKYISKEILASSDGSIIYFDEKLKGINAGYIYRGWYHKYFFSKDMKDIALELTRAGILSVDEYLKI